MGQQFKTNVSSKQSTLVGEISDCANKLQSCNVFNTTLLTEQEEYSLLKSAKTSSKQSSDKAKDKLVKHFFKFAFKEAKRKFLSIGGRINFEDLLSEANLGLLLAIDKFKLELYGTQSSEGNNKIRFSGYAKIWIDHCLNNYCLVNSSGIKFCTTKADIKIINNIAKALDYLKIYKRCCDLTENDITKLSKELCVNTKNIKKYVGAMNISSFELNNEVENECLFINAKEEFNKYQSSIENNIDQQKLLNFQESNLYNLYCEGYNLELIAEKINSNKETVRQRLESIVLKLNQDNKLKNLSVVRT